VERRAEPKEGDTVGLLGIILSLLLLMYLAYRGINVLVLAPILSLMAVAFAGGLPILGTYTQVFMTALGNYLTTYFPLFMLGAIFGKLMADSGSRARSRSGSSTGSAPATRSWRSCSPAGS
jgi:H+/gluconate symporter-like permease